MANVRRDGWVIRGGTDNDGWDMHLAFVVAGVLAVPAISALVIVATRSSGLAQFAAVAGAAALAVLIVWVVALFAFVVALGRKIRSPR